MKTLLTKNAAFARTLAVLTLASLPLAGACSAAEAGKPADLPAGSLVLRGPKRTDSANSPQSVLGTNSPEHWFGLQVERAMRTNGYSIITQAFDVDAFYKRFVPTLPVSDEIKQRLLAAPQQNAALRKQILDDVVGDIAGLHIRFLGTRMLGNEVALLFRDMEGTGAAFEVVYPVYIAYIAWRQPDGNMRLIDAQRFRHGELLSQTMRRRTLLELARKKLLAGRLTVQDQQFLSSFEVLQLFESRLRYGKFSLIKDAYEKLPPEVQNDRAVLYSYATTGDRSITDVLEPIEQWRRVYPGDPTPDLIVVDFYWLLYQGPRYVSQGPDRGTYYGAAFSPQEEEAVEAAIERANAWFADPGMEFRLAGYYEAHRPDKARALLQKAMKRFPVEPWVFAELLQVDLATSNFEGVAETLHLNEAALQTNLTEMVNVSQDYAAFRKSFPWKKWQHDYHGADAKSLTTAPTQAAK